MFTRKRTPHGDFTLVRVGSGNALSTAGYVVIVAVIIVTTALASWLITP